MLKSYKDKLRIALIYGGRSGEHEISLISAFHVLKALDKAQYEVVPVGIGKNGLWYRNDINDMDIYTDALPAATPLTKGVPLSQSLFDDIDVVFPAIHGPLYEDGALQGFLDLINKPYVGSGVCASALAMDKIQSKYFARTHGFPIVDFEVLNAHEFKHNPEDCLDKIIASLGFPMFVKPACLGSSVAINKVTSSSALLKAIHEALLFDEKVLIEKGLCAREIEIAVLGGSATAKASGPGEIILSNKTSFYSYDAKYIAKDLAEVSVPAQLLVETSKKIQSIAIDIFKAINCYGLARVDFFVTRDTQTIYFNEINTIPGFTPISMYPKLWLNEGLSYPKLINRLIELALERHRARANLLTDYR